MQKLKAWHKLLVVQRGAAEQSRGKSEMVGKEMSVSEHSL